MKKNFGFAIALTGLMATSLIACQSKQKQAEKKQEAVVHKDVAAYVVVPSPLDRTVAAENDASFVTEIAFDKGADTLSKAQKKSIEALIDRAHARGKIDDVKIVTWADMEYPSVKTKKLSKAEQQLASRRNKEVSSYVKSLARGVDVDTYNMASRPNSLERLLSTRDARIKRSLEVAGIPTTDSTVKIPSKSSKSIVMLVME